MDELRFSTSVDDERVEEGSMQGDTLVTESETRPNFRVEDDGSVTLVTKTRDIEGFGQVIQE